MDTDPEAATEEPASVDGATDDTAEPSTSPDRPRRRSWVAALRSVLGLTVVALTAVAIVVYGLPPSPINDAVPPWVRDAGDATMLVQNWALFAPDPPGTDVHLDFVITDTDGNTFVEELPSGPAWIPTARSERWRKIRERITPTSSWQYWREVLDWAAARLEARGIEVKTIELRRRWLDRNDSVPDDPGTESTFVYARLDVPSGRYENLDPEAPGSSVAPDANDKPAADASKAGDGRAERSDQ